MIDNEIIKAYDILVKFDFFGGQRAGRELWNEKPVDVQNKDIENFSKDVAFLKDFINRQKAEIERLNKKLLLRIEENDCLRNYIGIKCEEQAAQIIANYKGIIKTTKAEAIKEFAERIKKKSKKRVSDIYGARVYIQDIDDTKKEMVGDV